MSNETLLNLDIGVPLYAARGLTQTIDLIAEAGIFRRTTSGKIRNIAGPQFKLYKTSIICSDAYGLALDGIFPGDELVLDCVAELGYKFGLLPQREVIDGSSYQIGDTVWYRPRLYITVTFFEISRNEYGAVTAWRLEGEETG